MKNYAWLFLTLAAAACLALIPSHVISLAPFQTDTVQLTGAPGEELSEPVTARLLDRRGRGIQGALITFAVTQGGGSVWLGSSLTDSDGYARDYWTLGPDPAMNALEARTIDSETGQKIVHVRFEADTRVTKPTPVNCDDGNDCTSDSYDAGTASCVHAPVPNGTVCATGTCQNGVCTGACEND